VLYITTRNNNDAFTAHRTLGQGRGPDGGLFVPMQMPHVDEAYIRSLQDKTFGQNVADILNLFFKCRMDGWDIDFCLGRYPAKLVTMSHRIMVAETWHNPDYDFARAVRNISSRIRGMQDTNGFVTNWAWITARIATLFGLFGELYRLHFTNADQPVDIALPSGDFAGPMAAWYARKMGLPIGNIICSCDEREVTWDLLHYGETSANGVIPSDLERLVSATLGMEEARRFADLTGQGLSYAPPQDKIADLRKGMYAAVISWSRRESIINNVYRTSTYILDPGSAMAYGGLQDYRVTAEETRPALIITERSPICSAQTVATAMGITVDTLKERLNMS